MQRNLIIIKSHLTFEIHPITLLYQYISSLKKKSFKIENKLLSRIVRKKNNS